MAEKNNGYAADKENVATTYENVVENVSYTTTHEWNSVMKWSIWWKIPTVVVILSNMVGRLEFNVASSDIVFGHMLVELDIYSNV